MPPFIRRRLLLQAGLAAGALSTLGLPTRAFAADEFDVLRARWAELSTGGAIDAADPAYAEALANLSSQAQQLVDTMITAADRTALWPDLPLSPSSGNFSISYTRLKTIALARATGAAGYVVKHRAVRDLPRVLTEVLRRVPAFSGHIE